MQVPVNPPARTPVIRETDSPRPCGETMIGRGWHLGSSDAGRHILKGIIWLLNGAVGGPLRPEVPIYPYEKAGRICT